MNSMGFTPTDEQNRVVELAMTGDHLAIDALAGAAKTTTAVMIANAKGPGHKGLYMAFSKEICREAEVKFPSRWVQTSTIHALAFRAVGRHYSHRLNGHRLKSHEIANRLNINSVQMATPFGVKYLASGFLAGLVMKGIRRFSQSADLEPCAEHIPAPDTMRDDPEFMAQWSQIRKDLVPSLRKAWADVVDVNGQMTVTHDDYLKIWSLSNPQLSVDYLLCDESQDFSLAQLAVVNGQRDHAQLCLVGDVWQSIFNWRGSVNAMALTEVAHRAQLTKSFRFGPEIAAEANRVLAMLDPTVRVTGGGPSGRVGPVDFPDVVLSRTNAVAVRRALDEIDVGGKPHIVGGAKDVVSFAQGALSLQAGRRSYHPDLACFDDWNDVRVYVNSDELGGDLKLLVKLVEDFGADRIVSSLASMPSQPAASLVLSTAHAGKGKEWTAVQLADDFPDDSNPDRPLEDSEKRLCYVAVTRAKRELDVEDVPLLRAKAKR